MLKFLQKIKKDKQSDIVAIYKQELQQMPTLHNDLKELLENYTDFVAFAIKTELENQNYDNTDMLLNYVLLQLTEKYLLIEKYFTEQTLNLLLAKYGSLAFVKDLLRTKILAKLISSKE